MQEKMLSNNKVTSNKSVSPGLKQTEPMNQLLIPSKEPKDPTNKESSRLKRMNSFRKGGT